MAFSGVVICLLQFGRNYSFAGQFICLGGSRERRMKVPANLQEGAMVDQPKGTGTTVGEQPVQTSKRLRNFILLVLAGLALAIALQVFAPHLAVGARFDQILIFAAGAAAAVLVLRLMVQRERRVALQLVVSEIVGESASPEIAAMRILEALCVSQGWDAALRWEVNEELNRLEFCSAWGAPGRRAEVLVQESMGLTLSGNVDLAARVWQDGHPAWVADLTSLPLSPRAQAARRHGMVSGCAIPVRVGNKVLAVLEFYCHFCLRENREAMAAVETVATSLGQMLARSHERGRAEKLYHQQEILLDSVADGICGLDSHGLVSFANPAAARLLGAPASSLTGKPVHALLHGNAPSGTQCGEDCMLHSAIGRPTAASGEDSIFRIDGSAFPVDDALTPILDNDRYSGSVLSFRDISQRNALDRLKNEFISTVSHELRTPLTSIRGALGLLSLDIQKGPSDKAANLLRIALTNSDRLMSLINDILDLERLQSGLEPLAFQPVQLAQIVCSPTPSSSPRPTPPSSSCCAPTRPASPSPSPTMAAAFPPTSSNPSSAASSRWTPRTPGKRAERASAWPSAAPLSSNIPAASGRSVIPSADRPSASSCPTSRWPSKRRNPFPKRKSKTTPSRLLKPTPSRGRSSSKQST
jgi:PAS domain S-box-containing protein